MLWWLSLSRLSWQVLFTFLKFPLWYILAIRNDGVFNLPLRSFHTNLWLWMTDIYVTFGQFSYDLVSVLVITILGSCHLLQLSLGHDLLFCLALWSSLYKSIFMVLCSLDQLVRWLEIGVEFFQACAWLLGFDCEGILFSLWHWCVLRGHKVVVIRADLLVVLVNLLL